MFHFLKGKSKENVLYAPCKGKIVPLSEVPDPTFSEKILGDGFAVIPSEGKIYAPTDGEIAMVFDTLHAITLTSSSGNRNPDPHRTGYGYTKGRTVSRTRCSR